MKKKLWAVLVAFVALTVFATSAFAAVRWRNVASIYPCLLYTSPSPRDA